MKLWQARFAAIFASFAALAPSAAPAADTSLKDAIKCSDFKHKPDGSWYADHASLAYGPGNKSQTNFFDATITAKNGEIFAALNEKCGGGH